MSRGRGNGGGGMFGYLGVGSRLSAGIGLAAGIASSLTNYGNNNMGNMFQRDYYGTQAAMLGGAGSSSTFAQRQVFQNNYAALNTTDIAQSAYIAQGTFGFSQFNGQANRAFAAGYSQIKGFGYVSPTMGVAAAARAAQETYAPRAFYAAQALGLQSPIGAGGVQNSMGSIAQSIYRRTFGNQVISSQGLSASLKQGGSLSANLQYFGSQMGWSASTIQEYQNYISGMVTAQNRGISNSQYDKLIQQAASNDKSAQSKLKSIGIGSSAFEAQRNLNASRETRAADISESMAKAFTGATNTVNKFSEALTAFMKNTGLDKAVGFGAGTLAPFSNALGGFSSSLGLGAGLWGAARLFGGAGGAGGGFLGRVFGGMGTRGAAAGGARLGAMGADGAYNITTLGPAAAAGGGWGLGALGTAGTIGGAAAFVGTGWAAGGHTSSFNSLSGAIKNMAPFNPLIQVGSKGRQIWDKFQGKNKDSWWNILLNPWSGLTTRSGGGSSDVVGNTPGNGASNLGASAAQIIKYAETQLNVPYVWGGETPGKGFDCSGLIQWAYSKAGVKIPRVAADQQKAAKPVPVNQTQPGDLLFVGNPAHHVVMAIGGGKIIEAPHTGDHVKIRPLNPNEFTSAGRFINNIGNMNSLLGNSDSNSGTSLSNLQSITGGDLGSFSASSTSELSNIMAALSGGIGAGPLPLSSNSNSTNSVSASSTSVSGGTVPGNGKNDPASLKAYAKQLLTKRGWGNQWNSFNALVNSESSWNYKATNAQSGAYGIPQALPGNKMASAGSDWRTNGDTQLNWMMDYIAGRYGDPNKAWSFHQKNNWYDVGAWNITKDQVATVHQGEMIIPAQQAETIRQALLNNTFNPNVAKNSGGAGVSIGNIQVLLPSGWTGTQAQGQQAGKAIVDAIVNDDRIKQLQRGQ
jgi:cell wall-associated NlpC family hydrolase